MQDERELIELQVKLMYNKKYQRGENIATVLFTADSSKAGQKELLEALESKYDALRDKLLAEALIQQVMSDSNINLYVTRFQKILIIHTNLPFSGIVFLERLVFVAHTLFI